VIPAGGEALYNVQVGVFGLKGVPTVLTLPFRGRFIQAHLEGKIMLSIRAIFELDDGSYIVRYFKPGQRIPTKGLVDIQDYILVGNGQHWVSRATGRFSSRDARELPTKWVRGRMERVDGLLTECYIAPSHNYATFPRNAYGANYRVFAVRSNDVYCVSAETYLEVHHFIGLMRQVDMEPVEVCYWNGKAWERYDWKGI
jgi:hypothetical protein